MGDKITITTEKDGRTIVFEGSGTLMFTERVDDWVDTHPTSAPREGRGVEIKWDGGYTIREADRQPDTLDALAAEWEAAEEATADNPIREGDVVIVRNDSGIGGYFVRPSHETHDFELEAEGSLRVLSRAPKREPWADLADVLSEWFGSNQTSNISMEQFLHERGVRVTGGDES